MFKTPHLAITDENPVFDFELRRIKRLRSSNRLWWYGSLIQVVPCSLVVLFYVSQVVSAAYRYKTGAPSTNANYSYYFGNYVYLSDYYTATSALAAFVAATAILFAAFAGIYYLAVTIHSVNHQINNGHWDLLRLTPLPEEDIYDAKVTTGEIRAWRIFNLEIALRLMLFVLAVLTTLVPAEVIVFGQDYFGSESVWMRLWSGLQQQPVITVLEVGIVLIIALVWLVEPRWRMRALLALGLAISARVRNVSMSSLSAFFGLIGFYLGLITVAVVCSFLISRLNNALYYRLRDSFAYEDYYNLRAFIQFVSTTGFVMAGYLYYAMTRAISRRSVLRHAFKGE
ncbi:MAG: hypothetical protein U0528_17025 [Anaerolineae bacterium]